jgi:hypothetical protein
MKNTTTHPAFTTYVNLSNGFADGEETKVKATILQTRNEFEITELIDEDGKDHYDVNDKITEDEILQEFFESEYWQSQIPDPNEFDEGRDQDWEDQYVDHSKECYDQDF